MNCRLYKNAVSMLKITACGTCPAHKSNYTQVKEKFGWHTKLVGVYCQKLGDRVVLTGIDPRCPLAKWGE